MSPPVASIRALSARIRRFVAGMAAVLWLLLLLERFGAILLRAAQGVGTDTSHALAVQCISAVPEVFFLLALDATRRALAEIEHGQFYTPAITRMLDRVGILLALGAFVNVFLVPGLERAVGAGPGYWVAFDIAGLVLGTIGVSLSVISRVVAHGADLKAELDQIF